MSAQMSPLRSWSLRSGEGEGVRFISTVLARFCVIDLAARCTARQNGRMLPIVLRISNFVFNLPNSFFELLVVEVDTIADIHEVKILAHSR